MIYYDGLMINAIKRSEDNSEIKDLLNAYQNAWSLGQSDKAKLIKNKIKHLLITYAY